MKAFITSLKGNINLTKAGSALSYGAIHVLLVVSAILECVIAKDGNMLAATIIAGIIFALAIAYDKYTENESKGFTAAACCYAVGQLGNWLWYTKWPQDFEGMSTIIPIAIMWSIFGVVLQIVAISDD